MFKRNSPILLTLLLACPGLALACAAVTRHTESVGDAGQTRASGEAAGEGGARAAESAAATATNMENEFKLVKRDEQTFAVEGVPRVNVKTFEGAVTVRAWDRPEVSVAAVRYALDEKALGGIRVSSAKQDGGVSVRAEFTGSERQIKFGRNRFMTRGAYVDLEINVPRRSNLVVVTGDGALSLTGVEGDVDLRTEDGGIEVRGARGRLKATTNDGLVRVTEFEGEAVASEMGDHGLTLEGRFSKLTVKAGSGTITLALPAGFDAFIETNAERIVDEGMSFVREGDSPGGSRRLRVGRGGGVLSLHTDAGAVILRRLESPRSGARAN